MDLRAPDPTRRTERLELRPFRADDRDALFDIYRRPAVVRWLYTDVWNADDIEPKTAQRSARERFEADGDLLSFALVERRTGALIGDLTLALRSAAHRQGEVGFVLHPEAQGRGYATEALRALLELGFDAGLHRIYGRCDARNAASARVMERAGMRREAHFRHDEFFKGTWSDTLVYALLEFERAGPAGTTASGGGRPR